MQLWHCNEPIMTREAWQALGRVLPQDLVEARLLCHCAVQLLTAVADATLEHRDHQGQPCTEWLASHGALVGQVMGAGAAGAAAGDRAGGAAAGRAAGGNGGQTVRLGLRVADLSLLVLDGAGAEILAQVPLDGGTQASALGWFSARIEQFTGAPPARPPALREHDMPDHPASRGKAFVIGSEMPALEELARWCHNASAVLGQIQAESARAANVACRPRHFEIATRVHPEPRSEHAVVVGFSPGDRDIPEPYWYVKPWPDTDGDHDINRAPPPAVAGAADSPWTESGAVLLGSDVIGDGSAYAQESRSLGFLRSAINASRALRR